MKAGSLCTGYGGLEMAAADLIDFELCWVADNYEGSEKLLEFRHPEVVNLGDIRKINYSHVEPVDILFAGFPCQDVSVAGGRRGLREGTRTGLWSEVARAIDELRPSLVFLENVNGLLSGEADSDVERCPECMGDVAGDVVLRALGAVLGDLASLGFDAEWHSLYAAETGAPHRRERVFILAWPAADAGSAGRDGAAGEELPDGEPASSDFFAAYAEYLGLDAA